MSVQEAVQQREDVGPYTCVCKHTHYAYISIFTHTHTHTHTHTRVHKHTRTCLSYTEFLTDPRGLVKKKD